MSRFTTKALAGSLSAASLAALLFGLPGDESPAPDAAHRAAKAAPAAAPRCEFAAGEKAAFTLESTARDVRGDEADHLRGTLSWEVVDQLDGDRWRLRAALRDVSLTQALTLPEERVEGSLSAPFFVDVDASCRFVGFGFDPSWDGRRRRLVRAALLTHEYVAPASRRRKVWSAEQADGMGDFEASYELVPGEAGALTRVRRRKAAYDGASQAAAFGLAIAVVGSKATASFDPAAPHWLTASAGVERIQLRVQGEVAADLLQEFRLTRDDARFAPVPAMDPADADFRDAFDLEVERDALDDARTAQIPYEEALESFLARFGGTREDPSYAAARELAAWLRTHPEGPAQLAAALRGGEI
ncbi:MAG: hypothetical protein KC420_11255, partial [Myxococcales bacterium]|nr:hypothetical protein [Myxococcales bacterium]